jgi:hypothetical protein
MSSVIAWVGVDSRGVASAYFASDSRISWDDGATWNNGRKLFACRRYPHIFAYCGDVLFPIQTLSQITEMIDSDLIAKESDTIDIWTKKIVSIMDVGFKTYPPSARRKFDILYCMRDKEGLSSRFHINKISFNPSIAPVISSIDIPNCSEAVVVLGSGTLSMKKHLELWKGSDISNTSRMVFSAFCDSLKSGIDHLSAGPPQLVGLWRKWPPKTFGMIWNQQRYFYGTEVQAAATLGQVRWHNELFEICDPETLARKPDAQVQPRPKGL